LVSRALENAGIATTIASWNIGVTHITAPARALYTRFDRGSTLGVPGDAEGQRAAIEATLALLAQSAPLDPVKWRWGDDAA
jgi:hypothetical protein